MTICSMLMEISSSQVLSPPSARIMPENPANKVFAVIPPKAVWMRAVFDLAQIAVGQHRKMVALSRFENPL